MADESAPGASVPVIEQDGPAILDASAKKPAPRAVPKWEADARARVLAAVRKYNRPLADLAKRDANEGDTRLFVTDFLCDGLGYDKYADLTTEYLVKGEFADYGVRIDKQLIAFIEVKRIATKLTMRHLRQVEMYAVNEGVEWLILTNGADWQVYHVTGGLPVVIDPALEVNLLGEETAPKKAAGLFYLTREAMKKRVIDDLWKTRAATSPKSLAQMMTSEPVIAALRKELRRATGQNVEGAELARLLKSTVIRADAISG